MGKSAKLFKSLVFGVKVFKSPSKEKSIKEPSSMPQSTTKREDKRHGGKDKCMWSLGKSSSRSHDAHAIAATAAIAASASSPEAIEIKCVEVDSEKLKDVLPIPIADPWVEGSDLVKAKGAVVNPCHRTTFGTCSAELAMASEQEEWAAAKIQAAFRCYLAQRAFRALRALVRLQALARGRIVRKQASSSLRCMQSLIRIQALARGRHVRTSELGQVVQKHLQQARPMKKKPAEGWVNGTGNSHTRAQGKQDVAMKRQRALVAVLLLQFNKDAPKQRSFRVCDEELKNSHWAWMWLERWTVAGTSASSCTTSTTREEEHNAVADQCIEKEKAVIGAGNNKHKESFKKELKKGSTDQLSNSPMKGQAQIPKREETVRTPTTETEKVVKREEMVRTPATETEKGVKRGEKVKMPTMEMEKVVKREERVKISMETEKVGPKKANMFWSSPAMPTESIPSTPTSAPLLCLKDEVRASKDISLQVQEELPSLVTESMAMSASTAPDTRSPAMEIHPNMEEVYPNAADGEPRSPIHSTIDTSKDVAIPDPLPNGCMSPSLPSEPLPPSDPPPASPLQEFCVHGPYVPEMVEMLESTLGSERGEDTRPISEEAVDATDGLQVGLKDEEEAIDVDMTAADDAEGGKCDASVASFDEKCVKSGTKIAGPAGGGGSPAVVPSYMATTKSSKAKIRAHAKAEPKLDSPQVKTESPKLKLDTPLTPKPDSATKRRHSLSALDGSKTQASATRGTPKHSMHVRVNSKGHLKDMSMDGSSPLSNGGAAGSGGQRK